MNPLFVGAVADDDTGAADLAGMLSEQGMRAAVVLDSASPAQLRTWCSGCDALVIGTASRSIARQDAYTRTRAAIEALQELSAQRLAVKYCSTFDSTAEGNIGASLDAAMDATGVSFTIALPALPALDRTTYMGYHFVGRTLLSESPMRHHPLNPMTNAHLASHLATQTSRRVGLVDFRDVQAGPDAISGAFRRLQADGVEIALLDCVDDTQVRTIGESICDLPLLSGSSAWGMILPEIWRRNKSWVPSERTELVAASGGSGVLLVSGSCSEATRAQNAWAVSAGWQVLELDAVQLASGEMPAEALVDHAAKALACGDPCLITTTQQSSRERVEQWAAQRGLASVSACEGISATLARLTAAVMERCVPQGLVIAGGETSSTLMRALNLGGLLIGPAITPGVPLCLSLARPALGLVLKSGNFGTKDFFRRAVETIRGLRREDSPQKEIL